ncbi:MAG: histidine ammonia-lyase [candidate division Zixibacteria bacterium]|nr:histidine ammonia-lyase [candidate division Zixibacteria bacterium]
MISINGNSLNIDDFIKVIYDNEQVKLSPEARKNVKKCNDYLNSIVEKGETVYGINTGFGKLAGVRIDDSKLEELQENLLLSHAVGVGEPLSEEETRGVILLRANCLAKGYSGVREQVIDTLIGMLNAGVHPVIPSRGSVGASGDLAPLAHLALVLIGRGKAKYKNRTLNGATALKKAGLKPLKLGPKEGLALINGTQVMTALGLKSIYLASRLVEWADLIGAAGTDGILGSATIAYTGVSDLRPYRGQRETARNISRYLKNSEINLSHRNCGKVQDNYSFRCMPQVHGAVRNAVDYALNTLTVEANSVTDNPLIFAGSDKVISAGNFHGEPVALVLDYLSMAVAELGNISERRVAALLDPNLSGLPPFLALESGLNSGFMIFQVTAAALVSENKVLAHPSSVDSIPTSANQEDHVSMGTTSALKLGNILINTSRVLAIEMLSAAQAIDFRRPMKSSNYIEWMVSRVREELNIPFIKHDQEFTNVIDEVSDYILETSPEIK